MKHGGRPFQPGEDSRRWRGGRGTRYKGAGAVAFERAWRDPALTVTAIEAIFGLPRNSAYYVARRLGLPHRSAIRRKPMRYCAYVRSLIQRDYFVRGLSYQEIRRIRGYSDWIVRRAIREADVPLRSAA